MTPEDIAKVQFSKFSGVRPRRRGFPKGETVLIGLDIETVVRSDSRALATGGLYQHTYYAHLYGDRGLDVGFPFVDGSALETLLAHVEEVGKPRGGEHCLVYLYAHNVAFDLGVTIAEHLLMLHERHGLAYHLKLDAAHDKIEVEVNDGKLTMTMGGARHFGSWTHWVSHQTVHVRDTMSVFKGSLAGWATRLGLGEKKTPPWELAGDKPGEKEYPAADVAEYCREDARLAYLLGCQIREWAQERDVPIPISAPQLSAFDFTRHYVSVPWVPLPRFIQSVAMSSYHGGRNGLYVEPGWHEDVALLDVNSAYTWAMTRMPDMTAGEWRYRTSAEPTTPWSLIAFDGEIPETRFPVLVHERKRGMVPCRPGEVVRGLTVTGMEYLKLRELAPSWSPRRIRLLLEWHPDSQEPSDLARYMTDLWAKRKAAVKGSPDAELYKLEANSLYGKFIQRNPTDSPEVVKAGPLFHAPIATWVTAMVRCLMIDLEHRWDALHTATDSIMTRVRPTPPDSVELGALKRETQGVTLLLRNKDYLIFDRTGVFLKGASLGFQSTPEVLVRMLLEGRTDYRRERLLQWKQAAAMGLMPYTPREWAMETVMPLKQLHDAGQANPFNLDFQWETMQRWR